MVTLKYSNLSTFQFAQAVQKIASNPTHGQKASQIHKVIKVLSRARDEMTKAYETQITEVYGKRDEAGKLIRPPNAPNEFEPIEEKIEELKNSQKNFFDTSVELDCSPFTLDLIADIKISAQDLEALSDLYIGNREDQGKPSLQSVI